MKKLLAILTVLVLLMSSAFAASSIYRLNQPVDAQVTYIDSTGSTVVCETQVILADAGQYESDMAAVVDMANTMTGEPATVLDIAKAYAGSNIDDELASELSAAEMVTGILDVAYVEDGSLVRVNSDVVIISVAGTVATQGFDMNELAILQFAADATVNLLPLSTYDPETGDYSFELTGDLTPFMLVMQPK